ncbi:MAG: hypothetical protein H6667_05895 [Ardenticatenaceae bacterium]|nr:hypothetical protein [Ardenticatenaceae bacterium]MCB9443723.1 hypothetical protein [Ardenticatenaceae bacterium]
MKKYWKFATIVTVLVAVVALVGVTAIYAQGPANNGAAGQAAANRSGLNANNESGLGLMAVDEADMHAVIADALGMSLDEFEAAIAAGETPSTLALELGIDLNVIQEAMDAAHAAAFEQAVADGLITQEQADWILSHRGGTAGQSGSMQGAQNGTQGTGNGGYSNGTGTGECMQ